MKNAILISGSTGVGKSMIALRIAHGKKTVRNATHEAMALRLEQGVEVVIVDGVTGLSQIGMYLPYIAVPAHTGREGQGPFTVQPFFVFLSQQVRSMPPNFEKHIGHFHLTEFIHGITFVDATDGNIPGWASEAIKQEMAGRKGFAGATAKRKPQQTLVSQGYGAAGRP